MVDFDGESSNATASRRFVTVDRHFVTADHRFVTDHRRFRRLIVDFDAESMIRDDSLTQSVSSSSISTRSRRFRPGVVTLRRLIVTFDRSVVTLRRLIVDFDGESSISTESRHFGSIDRHSATIDRRFRWRVVDFDRA
jgi:hypothetical protein